MSRTFVEVRRDALDLPEKERADLAALLIESLEGEPDPGVEAAWAEEISRRLAEVEAGTATTIPWEQVRQRALDRLKEG